jgi:hypothetical protein
LSQEQRDALFVGKLSIVSLQHPTQVCLELFGR